MMDEPVDDVPGQRPGPTVISWHGAVDVVARAALPPVDRDRILALPYPVDHEGFWQVLAALGVTQEGLMDRMGASP
jgi:hypothetical protein